MSGNVSLTLKQSGKNIECSSVGQKRHLRNNVGMAVGSHVGSIFTSYNKMQEMFAQNVGTNNVCREQGNHMQGIFLLHVGSGMQGCLFREQMQGLFLHNLGMKIQGFVFRDFYLPMQEVSDALQGMRRNCSNVGTFVGMQGKKDVVQGMRCRK